MNFTVLVAERSTELKLMKGATTVYRCFYPAISNYVKNSHGKECKRSLKGSAQLKILYLKHWKVACQKNLLILNFKEVVASQIAKKIQK